VAVTRLPRGQRFAEQGSVDLFVAATAVWDLKPDDPRLWEPALDIGRRMIQKAEMKGDRSPSECPSTYHDFTAYKKSCNPSFIRVNELYQRQKPKKGELPFDCGGIQAFGVSDSGGLARNIVISRGNVGVKNAIQMSVVLVNGNLLTEGQVSRSVVVCDGDVEITDQFTSAIVVARGSITAKQGAIASVLMAGGKVTLERQEERYTGGDQFNVIREKAVKPLGITFFELSTVGVEAKAADKVVQVSAVADKKAFAKAGLAVGDTILEVNGKKPTDAESLRRLLRDALAIGDATVKLQRGDKTETAKISLPE